MLISHKALTDGYEAAKGEQDSDGTSPKSRVDKGRVAFLTIVGVFLLLLGYSTIFRAAWNDIERTDFTVYRAAGEAVLHGTDVYEGRNVRGWAYVYPPPFAVLMVPFALLPLAWGVGVWYLVTLGMLASAVKYSAAVARDLIPTLSTNEWGVYELPVFLLSPMLLSGIARCQASEWMVWLVIASVYWELRRRPFLGGVALGVATLIKAFPIVLLAYYAWGRRWRFIGGFVVALLVGGLLFPACTVGWDKTLNYWQEWLHLVAAPSLQADEARKANPLYDQLLDTLKPRNQSLQALLFSLRVPAALVTPLWVAISSVLLGAILLFGSKPGRSGQPLAVSACLAWLLVIPPISESHYFGVLLLPLALLTALYKSFPDVRVQRFAAVCLWQFGAVSLVTALDKSLQLQRLLCWSTLFLLIAFLLLPMLLRERSRADLERRLNSTAAGPAL